ncbi:hypothetical protein CA12_26430 [Alienimonas californiensis]|uniref:Uncharacterized protein n=1 Tax=Alienimonas californiensis TaxID=2527989 RepID=A0A517PAY9_9PLAN|nr:hypothetical protein CA12_26430 [Alienimonas californiensis]
MWWRALVAGGGGLKPDARPHLNNESFQSLVRGGLIGSTRPQAPSIDEYIKATLSDGRWRLRCEQSRRLGAADGAG